ncbi:twin-arginine translocase subunit TatC [Thermodesulfobacteriota bacterium]
MSDEAKQPFLSHLEELRSRLIRSIIAVVIVAAGAYYFAEDIFNFLTSPLMASLAEDERMIFTSPFEMIFTYIKIAVVTGLLISSPYVFLQFWKFIAPGLYRNEKKYVIPFVVSSSMLFVGGLVFGYLMVLPLGFKVLLGMAPENVDAAIKVNEYFSDATKMLIGIGLGFEMPIVIFFLTKMGVVSTAFLRKNRKYAILLTFIAAAIFTPPDPVTQCIMAGPLILLFEAGLLIARFAEKKKTEESDQA